MFFAILNESAETALDEASSIPVRILTSGGMVLGTVAAVALVGWGSRKFYTWATTVKNENPVNDVSDIDPVEVLNDVIKDIDPKTVAENAKILNFVNSTSMHGLKDAGIAEPQVSLILNALPVDNIKDITAIEGVGDTTLEKLRVASSKPILKVVEDEEPSAATP